MKNTKRKTKSAADEQEPKLTIIQEFIEKALMEETEEEWTFFGELQEKCTPEERRQIDSFSGMTDEEENERLLKVREVAEKYDIPLPTIIKRQLREWIGTKSFEEIKKTKSFKNPQVIAQRIHDQIPLSKRSVTRLQTPDSIKWVRTEGNREICLQLILGQQFIEPAFGDLAKRTLMTICKFAQKRDTGDPGAITFRQILDQLGERTCSQATRNRIKGYLESFAAIALLIRKIDGDGREYYFDYAPFFKRLIWKGKLELDSKIFPIFNDELQDYFTQNVSQYVWLTDDRLKPQKRLSDRERLVQDKFQMIQGLPVHRRSMRDWLKVFAQFPDSKIESMSLAQIRDFVNRCFVTAAQNRRVKSFKIQSFRSKKKYLDQMIFIYPLQPETPDLFQGKLTEGDKNLIDKIIEWAYDKRNEFFVKIPKSKTREDLENYIKKYGAGVVKDRFREYVALTEDVNWYPDTHGEPAKSLYMKFWNDLKWYKREQDSTNPIV